MTDFAWMSVASVNLDIVVPLRTEMSFSDDAVARQRYLDASNGSQRGERIPEGVLPKTFFAWRGPHDSGKPLKKKLSHLANSGFWFVTSEAADVLRQFDLGGCRLHPVEVLMEDRKTPLPGSYFVLDFDSWKDVFLPDQSPDVAMMRGSSFRRSPRLSTKDDAAVLSRSSLEGADLWWNENVIGTFFLSDRLVQALRKAGVDKPFTLRRCRIV
jgi:hypothetical protein